MEFDMEELKRRRQEREKLRQEQQKQQKKTVLRLVIAAVVLLACGILIFVISTRNSGENAVPTQTQPETQATEPTEKEQEAAQTVIHFAAAGDLNITDKVVGAGSYNYDYTAAFLDVLPLLSKADITAINLEGNLFGEPYGTKYASAPNQLMTALLNAGVDYVQVANSYAIKNGFSGLVSTLQNIRSAGLETLGAYVSEEEFRQTGGYSIRVVDGVKVAVVAFTKGMDGMALPVGSEQCVNLLYTDYSSAYQKVNTQGITKILRAIEKEKPDITIALLHWGSEFNDTHSKSQESIRKLMLSEGVDAIIGTHPHYVQAILYDEAAGTLVAYSLGDFFGDGSRSGTEYSVILDLEITKDNTTGKTTISNYTYTPIYTVNDEETLRVVRLEEAMASYQANALGSVSKETYDNMAYALTRIKDRVTPDLDEE